MQNDMTKGSPLRLIVFFTIPVLLGNIFQNVYNLMDSIIVGRFLGVNALAAVGATGTLTFLVFGWVTGMTGGFGILLAQSFGAGDEKSAKQILANSFSMLLIFSGILTIVFLLTKDYLLRWFGASADIFPYANTYMTI